MKNKYLIALGLLCFGPKLWSMELEEKPAKKLKTEEIVVIASNISELPVEKLEEIFQFLSSNIEIFNCSLQQLRLVNKQFKSIIDDEKMGWALIKFLSRKFKLSPIKIATKLKIPSSKAFLEKFDFDEKDCIGNLSRGLPHYKSKLNLPYLEYNGSFIIPIFQKNIYVTTDDESNYTESNRLLILKINPDGKINYQIKYQDNKGCEEIDGKICIAKEHIVIGIDSNENVLIAHQFSVIETSRERDMWDIEPSIAIAKIDKIGKIVLIKEIKFSDIYRSLELKAISLPPIRHDEPDEITDIFTGVRLIDITCNNNIFFINLTYQYNINDNNILMTRAKVNLDLAINPDGSINEKDTQIKNIGRV